LGKASLDYLNYPEGDYDATESTYHCSEFKPTPFAAPGFVTKFEDRVGPIDKNENENYAGYFLRSTVTAPHIRTTLELPAKICSSAHLTDKWQVN